MTLFCSSVCKVPSSEHAQAFLVLLNESPLIVKGSQKGTLKRKPPYCEGVSIFLRQKNGDSCGFICYIFGLIK